MNGKEKQQRQVESGGYYKQPPAKMPEVPDLTAKMIMPPRADPFVLTNYTGKK